MTTITYEYPSAEGDPYYPIPRPENQELFKRYEALADATDGRHLRRPARDLPLLQHGPDRRPGAGDLPAHGRAKKQERRADRGRRGMKRAGSWHNPAADAFSRPRRSMSGRTGPSGCGSSATGRARAMSRATPPTRRARTRSTSTCAMSTCRCPTLGERAGEGGGPLVRGASRATSGPRSILVLALRPRQQTAEIICEQGALAGGPARTIVDERLREREFGIFDRLTTAGIRAPLPRGSRAPPPRSANSTTGRRAARAGPT